MHLSVVELGIVVVVVGEPVIVVVAGELGIVVGGEPGLDKLT